MHALLPTSPRGGQINAVPAKFVDRGVPLLLDSLVDLGARRTRVAATLCGGAQLLSRNGRGGQTDRNGRPAIGKLNILAAEVALQSAGLWIRARATGGKTGRTVRFYMDSGRVTIKSLDRGERVLR